MKLLWVNLRTSFWFVPFLIVVSSIVLAVALITADSVISDRWLDQWPILLGVDAVGARAILSTIAGSMMTVVGVTFSMTLVTLSLASSQYSSRILSNFMRDRVTQVVLGIFAGIFTYCLIVLRTIRVGDYSEFVASLAVSFSIVLAIGGIGVLIYFIHHIAYSIQAASIIALVADETMVAVDRLFPGAVGRAVPENEVAMAQRTAMQQVWQTVLAIENGYVQSVNDEVLISLACKHKAIVRMELGIGSFLVQGTPLVSVLMDTRPGDELAASLQAAYTISRHRTVEQDCAFGIRQIVDMAMRALSPGINDTTTAVTCVNYLTAILSRLVLRDIPSPYRLVDGALRVITVGPTFESLVSDSYDQIRSSAAGNLAMMLSLLTSIHTIASLMRDPLRHQVLRVQVALVAELADRTLSASHERALLEHSLAQVQEALAPVQLRPTGAEQ